MDQETLGKELQKFNVTDAAIVELSNKYMILTAEKDGEKACHTARMDIKGRRISVEKTRKELKEDALRYGQAIDKEAKRITALLEPIEKHLDSEEGKIQAEKDRIKAEADAKEAARLQARFDTICTFGAIFNGQTYTAYGLQIPVAVVKAYTDDQFKQFIAQVQEKVDAEQVRIAAELQAKKAEEDARKTEAERLAKVAAEQEAERKRLEEAGRKQAEEAARIKAEQEATAQKIRDDQAAIEREKQRLADAEAARLQAIEDEKARVAIEKIRAEELEQARKEAAEKALRDAEEKTKREAAEKIEKERLVKIAAEKKEARRPDKEKLSTLANVVEMLTMPELKTVEGKNILTLFENDLSRIVKSLRDRLEGL